MSKLLNFGIGYISGSIITQFLYNKKIKELNFQIKKICEELIIDD